MSVRDELTALPNVGKTLAAELRGAGIDTPEALRATGSVEAAARIAAGGRERCYNLLYALEGAIRGVRWHSISKDDRAALRAEFDGRAKKSRT